MVARRLPIATASSPAAPARAAAFRYDRVLIYGLLAFFAFIYLFPGLIVVFNAFRSGGEVARNGIIALPEGIDFGVFVRTWNNTCVSGMCRGLGPNFLNSLIITIPATLISTAFGALNGYVLAKWRFPGDKWVFFGILFGVFMPMQITLLPGAFVMGKIGLANSVYGLLLIHSVQGIAFTTLFCRNFFASIPDELIKAARVDGAGFFRIFVRIMMPLAPPIIAVCLIWQFTSIWNDYLFGMIFTSGSEQPITVALMSARAGGQSAAVIMAAVPPLLVYLLGGRWFVRGLMHGALK